MKKPIVLAMFISFRNELEITDTTFFLNVERHPPSVDKITVKKLVDFIKDKGDDTIKDDVRKTQRMLEEMLTRNMNLEKVME